MRNTSTRSLVRRSRCIRESGEVFPVAILFGGVLITILIGVHVVLHSLASTAAQAAADSGVAAAQAAPLGGATDPALCPPLTDLDTGGEVDLLTFSERQCQGASATWAAMRASTNMVGQYQPPAVVVDNEAGVVKVLTFGSIVSPMLGQIEVIGVACGPLDLVGNSAPTRADAGAC
ncbi:hypothetical protein [Candidatus Poriferisodalis sp.]|uniref:hypothetical protein n=1 Tax=Candidatus Poriferisodalis sp. TaxID=3101277 RepID=UPI003B027C6F